MFCCSGEPNKDVYELRNRRSQKVETKTLIDMKGQRYPNHLQILKISRSDYRQLIQQYKESRKMWQDQEFPPNLASLGEVPGVNFQEWKRLSSIINNPVLFDGRIEPQDVIQGSLGDCYFLSAVSALAEKEERIRAIFGEQGFNRNGIYKVTLRIGGIIQEIVVDDFVPVNRNGQPIFCQPNKNEFWVPILQKAWAKANGSYANIIAGSPIQLFKAATYAPAETIETSSSKQKQQLLWQIILKNARRDSPCCCGTSDSSQIRWGDINLVPGHAYTLIDAAELQDFDGNSIRMLKLRNPWGNTEWQGEGCETDKKFWSAISKTKSSSEFLKNNSINDDGIFYITFRDYCKYFVQTHISYMEDSGNYISESFMPLKKRGSYWNLDVIQESQYFIELHQVSTRSHQTELKRATIVLARNTQQSFEYVGGVLSHYQQDSTLRAKLAPGKYTIFTKFDLQQDTAYSTQNASISIYSLPYVILSAADRSLFKNFIKECFLGQARLTKRKRLQNDSMWISWKLLFKEGGYAYIAFGVQKSSTKRLSVTFDESEFTNGNFKLKKPYKGKGESQVIVVRPGEEKIVVARVVNKNVSNLKFPPAIKWEVLPEHQ